MIKHRILVQQLVEAIAVPGYSSREASLIGRVKLCPTFKNSMFINTPKQPLLKVCYLRMT